MIIGEAWVALRPETTTFGGELKKKLEAAIGAQGAGLQASMNKLGVGVLAGAGAIGVIGIKLQESLQKANAQIAANADISVGAATKITAAFQSTAFHSIFSAQQMGTAYAAVAGQLGSLAGHALSAKEALSFMTTASELAEATGKDLNTTTGLLAKVMQTLGLGLGDARTAADTLFSTSRQTGIGVDELGNTMLRLHAKGGVALGSIKDMGALLLDLSQHGVTGGRGLMVVNSALQALIEPGAKASQEQLALSKSMFDSKGNFEGFRGLLEKLTPKLRGLTQEQQLAYLKTVGLGAQAKALLDVITAGPAAFDKAAAAVSKQNAAHEAAEKQSKTFHHQVEELKAGLIDEGEKVGNFLIPKIIDLGHAIGDVIGWFEKHKAVAMALAAVIGTVLAASAISALISALGSLVAPIVTAIGWLFGFGGTATVAAETASVSMEASLAQISAAVTGIATEMGVAVEAAGVGMEGTAVAAEAAGVGMQLSLGPIILIMIAVAAVAYLVVTHWKDISRVATEVGHAVMSGLGAAFNWIKEHWPLLLAILTGPFGIAVLLIVQHFTEIKNAIVGFFGDAIHWLEDAGHKIIDGLLEGLKFIGHIYEFLYIELPQKLLGFLVDAGKWLWNIGAAIIDGLLDGLKATWHKVEDWLGGIKDVLHDVMTAGGLIGSPSPLFHQYGAWIMEGLANGIAANAHLPALAVRQIHLVAPQIPGLGPLGAFGAAGSTSTQLLGVLQQLTHETRQNTAAVQQQTAAGRQPQTIKVQQPATTATNPIAALAMGVTR